jgi:hypothetical protein
VDERELAFLGQVFFLSFIFTWSSSSLSPHLLSAAATAAAAAGAIALHTRAAP